MLCLAVMLSVMVVGAGAAFSDQDKIENTEAVDACSALNIINGYEDGAFHPERNIKRAEVTKMICVALNGGEEPNTSTNAKPTFTDVRGTIYAWAEGYIESCYAQGIVDGVNGNRFAPASNVTAAQLAKMLLVSLGYNAKTENFTGNAWETNVNVRAAQKGLYDGLAKLDTSAAVTRDQAAQMVWNAMQAYEVEYKDGVLQDKVVESTTDRLTLLYDKYEAYVNVGTLTTIEGKELGILMSESDKVDSDTKDVKFLDVNTDYSSLLGQKVKIMFKKTNEVMGVYATKDNALVTVNQNEIDVDAGKIVIGDKSYAVEKDGVTVIRDGETITERWKAGAFKDQQSADVITLIDTDNNNKVDAAYIKTVDVEKVTYVAASQIIAGSKTYRFADDNIAKDIKKDDWVIITKNLYNENNDIVVAEKKTGTVNATKSGDFMKYQIDETWFNETDSSSADINSNVKPGVKAEYVAVNGILYYAVKTTGTDKLTDVLFVAFRGKDGLSNDQARVMFPNGDKDTINLKNTYAIKQNGEKSAEIKDGTFYEYSKSGSNYELIELSYTEDFYGEFTARKDATTDGKTMSYTNGKKEISDSADVIVWTRGTGDNANTIDFKHITGKQFKSLIGTLEIGDENGKLDDNLLGGFTSDVDGLNRASVLAVKYNSTNGKLSSVFDNISANANYGFITKDAIKLANGNIKFTVWTGTENVEVIAEKSREGDFKKGTIVGYTDIQEKTSPKDETTYVMTDAVAIINGVEAGSITGVNTKGTKIESSTITLPSSDLDDYSTVLYVDSKAGTGKTDGKAVKANSQKVGDTTYYATNLLVFGEEVIVIDVNEIAGSRYNAYTLDEDITGLRDVQWLNTRTNDTDEGKAYPGAVMELSFYADKDGDLLIDGVQSVEKSYNVDNDTVKLPFKASKDKNVFSSLIVVGNVTASVNGQGGGTTTNGNVTITNNLPENTSVTVSKPSKVTGKVDIMVKVPDYIPNGAAVKFDYELNGDGAVLESNSVSGSVANGYVKATPTVDVSGYDKLAVTLDETAGVAFTDKVKVNIIDKTGKVTVDATDTSADLTTSSANDLKIKAKTVSDLVAAGAEVTVTGLATAANNKVYTLNAAELWDNGAAGTGKTLVNDKAAGDQAVVITITKLTNTVGSNKVTVKGLPAGYTAEPLQVSQAGESKNIVIEAPAWVSKAKVQYRVGTTGAYTTSGELAASANKLTVSSVAFAAGTSDITVEVADVQVTEATLAFEKAAGVNVDGTKINKIDINSKSTLTAAAEDVTFQASGNNTEKAKITFKVENIDVTTSAQCVKNNDGSYTLTWTANADNNTAETVSMKATGAGAAKIVVTAISSVS